MKKFEYSLDSFLKVLELNRDKELKKLKKIENELNQLKNKYSLMEEKRKESYRMNSQMGKNSMSILSAQNNNQFIRLLKMKMEDTSVEMSQIEKRQEDQYKAFMEFQKKVKKIEHHKEIKFEEYKKKIKKKNQKIIDEINSSRKRVQV